MERCTSYLWIHSGDIEHLHRFLCTDEDDLDEISEKYIWGNISNKDIKEIVESSSDMGPFCAFNEKIWDVLMYGKNHGKTYWQDAFGF